MRPVHRARWATCALALSICSPARADRSLAACTTFDQADQADAKVAFTIHSTCTIPIDCHVSWRVVCAPASKKRRATYPSAVRFALAAGGDSESTLASAAVCGDDSWTIDSVRWRCQPSKD
jgi:hypothetical protein